MSVDVGTRLGSLEITALLGKGGMGEVYRARDTKLKRDVARKREGNFCEETHKLIRKVIRIALVKGSDPHPSPRKREISSV